MKARTAVIAVIALSPVLAIAGCVGGTVLILGEVQTLAEACGQSAPGVQVQVANLPTTAIAGYEGEQLANAAAIVNAGQAQGLSVRGQTIGVMTAMGESTLRVLDYGDAVGPDSRGLFQQRANGAWGTYADRMDPTISATNFFKALVQVEGWETLAPTIAAHRTQRNADPYHYATYWDAAVEVVTALAGGGDPAAAGAAVAGVAAGTGELACTAATPATALAAGQVVSAGGWVRPSTAPITSDFGPRTSPTAGASSNHQGVDFGAKCEEPILAAAAGTVVTAGTASGYGHLITIDHGASTTTRYAHMYAAGMLVRVGQQVTAGQQIARVGSDGTSTACHLHFEVRLGGTAIDPETHLTAQGITV